MTPTKNPNRTPDAPPQYPLNARPDVPDLRDWPYEPNLRQLKRYLKVPPKLKILDQQNGSACTGFALAAIINLQNRERGIPTTVSPRMLYEMAKRHDEWPGEGYAGSSCRGAIKGWYNMGVCSAAKWPYKPREPGDLTVARAKDARKHTVGAYYRIQPRISDFHAALNETGTIYCSAHTHRGWLRASKKTGVIPFEKERMGGHAFAIVGYTAKGFWVQNSWSERWGKKGLGLWQYEDWLANLMDAWVFSLALPTPQIWHLPQDRERNRSGASLKASPPRSEIAGHFIHADDGDFHTQGRYWSSPGDVLTTAGNLAKSRSYDHLLLYAHGGLNTPKDSARRIAAMLSTFKKNRIYPYHFMYDTGLMEELKDVILRRRNGVEKRAGGLVDWTDRLIEWGTRIPGRALWREMKDGAYLPFLSERAGTRTLQIFLDALDGGAGNKLKIHLVGHSTGGILLAWLVDALKRIAPDARIASCSLLAPAATVELFHTHYLPALRDGRIERMQVLALNDELERKDQVAGIYRKSLLYLVSNAFEEEPPAPLLGMARHNQKLALEADLGDRLQLLYSNGVDSETTRATSHGGFDNDPYTMNHLLHTILREEPKEMFTKETLSY